MRDQERSADTLLVGERLRSAESGLRVPRKFWTDSCDPRVPYFTGVRRYFLTSHIPYPDSHSGVNRKFTQTKEN